MKHYAVIGCPIGQSSSPEIYRELFTRFNIEADFQRMLVTREQLPLVNALTEGLSGFAVTMPHKQRIIPYLDSLDSSAFCGSVNIVRRDNGCLTGFNTDGRGLIAALREMGFEPHGKRIAVLGRGGAAVSAAFALRECGAEVDLLVRSIKKSTDAPSALFNSYLFESYDRSCSAFINATPLGMLGMPGFFSFDFIEKLSPQLIFDMVYLPGSETELVRHAQSMGITAASGYKMLYQQALLAFEIWYGIKP